jgi:hypothetical protein
LSPVMQLLSCPCLPCRTLSPPPHCTPFNGPTRVAMTSSFCSTTKPLQCTPLSGSVCLSACHSFDISPFVYSHLSTGPQPLLICYSSLSFPCPPPPSQDPRRPSRSPTSPCFLIFSPHTFFLFNRNFSAPTTY